MAISLTAPRLANRLSYRTEQALTAGAVVLGAGAATLAGARPTGGPGDPALIAVSVMILVAAASYVPRWMTLGFAVLSTVIAVAVPAALIGCAGVAVASLGHRHHRDDHAFQAVSAALAANALMRSDLDGFFGSSASLAIVASIVLVATAVVTQERIVRRHLCTVAAAVVAIVVLALVGGGVQAARAANDAEAAVESARAAASAIEAGDLDAAARHLDTAAASMSDANQRLDSWTAQPARALPVVSQHLRVGSVLGDAAARLIDDAAVTVRAMSPDSLGLVDGRVDVDAVVSLDAPLTALVDELAVLRSDLDRLDSPWLHTRVRDALTDGAAELEDRDSAIQSSLDAVRLAPGFLGADDERRYLLLFTTPAELRGTGGFIGNFAELTVADGRLSIGDFARRADLEEYARDHPLECAECPSELLESYGRFGFASSTDGSPHRRVWSNLTMPAHFPDVAEAARILYPQSGGRPIDGVITIDPFVLQALMHYTGPAELVDPAVTIHPDGAADYILRDQYLIGDEAKEQRVDGLDQLATQVLDSLLGGALPDPATLARDLAPLADEGRLQIWTFDAAEQAVLQAAGVSGALPDPEGHAIGMTINNAGANKIDVFLERSVTTTERVGDDGTAEIVTEVVLTNHSPTSGLPGYVIGNEIGVADGTSRSLVTFYVADPTTSVEADGGAASFESGREAAWLTRRHFVELAAGESISYRVVSPLASDDPPGDHFAWQQPLSER